MKILAVANQKGGVGKSTMSVHFSYGALERGLRACHIDLSPQGNSSYSLGPYHCTVPASALFSATPIPILEEWKLDGARLTVFYGDPELTNIEGMSLAEAAANFNANIQRLMPYFDVAITDLDPILGNKMAAVIASATHAISPVEADFYAVMAIGDMLTTISNMQEAVNPGLKYLGMVLNKVDTGKPRHVEYLNNIRESYPHLLVPVHIGFRTSIGEALEEQKPVWRVKKTAARAAAKEFRALNEYVFAQLEATA